MALSTSPRKVVPLARGDEGHTNTRPISGHSVTKRIFFSGVVVENPANGRRHPEDIQELVASLGKPLGSDTNSGPLTSSPTWIAENLESESNEPRNNTMIDQSAWDVLNELVATERSYVKRLHTLKFDYADPLRKFSRSKDTSILPAYEAKILFGNVDNLLPVNEAFLTDLEKMMGPSGPKAVGGIGDVALKHFRDLRGFEHYKQYYAMREEAQTIFEREMSKKSSGFAAFIDRIKYSSADTKNRVGLRELLMDPVQRIPRYTLMFRAMIKHMSPEDPQRAKLMQADEAASKIALAETDEQTKRAAIMYCLSATIDEFPPGLISNSRRLIDCIDVEDILSESSSANSSQTSLGQSLHCTLFLFDDKLMIVKRPGNGEKGGRALAGLGELEKMSKVGGLPLGMKKSGMSCKGVVDITDVVATDVGGADIHLYLENPPQDQTERWSGRPFRSLAVVLPPAPVNLEPIQTEASKLRFLENMWHAQAMFRTRAGQSIALRTEETEVESRGGRLTMARTYFNVYQRKAFLQESKKTKVVLHIDPLGTADPLPFGMNSAPFVVIRIQPMAGMLSRYTVTSTDPNDEGEEDIVQTTRVPGRVVQTIHQYGLFKFKTGNNSLPSTPTSSARSRAAIFGLDAISRNLFNARPGSTRGDLFGGSTNSRTRTKSTTSRSSMYTQSTSTADDSLMRFSHRSNSTATQATTISTTDGDSFFSGRSSPRKKKLFKRGKSPGGSETDTEWTSPFSSPHRAEAIPRSKSASSIRDMECFDVDDDQRTIIEGTNQSEWDLSLRLELARQNSLSQPMKQGSSMDRPVEETIYEEEPPQPIRPPSRMSRDSKDTNSQHTITPLPQSGKESDAISYQSRSSSQHSSERRLFGPRSPPPLPPPKSPNMRAAPMELPSMDVDLALEATLAHTQKSTATPTRTSSTASPLPRSKRQPFLPTGNTETTPKATPSVASVQPRSTEPLSIKKKTSVRTSNIASPTPARKSHTKGSPLSRTGSKMASPRRVSPQVRSIRTTGLRGGEGRGEGTERLIQVAQSTKEDVESSCRAIKRIKLELDSMDSNVPSSDDESYRTPSPDKGMRTPQRGPPLTKAAQERMEEMRQLIGKRGGEGTPRSLARSPADPLTPRKMPAVQMTEYMRSMKDILSETDKKMIRAAANHEVLQEELVRFATDIKERAVELERTRTELQNSKRQCELIKSLLADATTEKEIMYEAFNEELDGMYNDINQPMDEALTAMARDLQQTKEKRNALTKENVQLKRQLAEVQMQNEEWEALLRAHGLIS